MYITYTAVMIHYGIIERQNNKYMKNLRIHHEYDPSIIFLILQMYILINIST